MTGPTTGPITGPTTSRAAPPAARRDWSPRRRLWARGRALLEAGGRRSTPGGFRRSPGRYLYPPLYRLLSAGLAALKLDGRGLRNALDVRVGEMELVLAALPAAFDGYRVLHVSDPHFDMDPRLGAAIRRAVAGLEVDLCVLTGDYRAADDGPHAQILEPLAALAGAITARDGILAILGNHDSHDMVEAIEGLGIGVLLNETVRLVRDGQVLSVTGLDDVSHYYTPEADLALAAAGPFGPRHAGLALVHSAEMAEEAAAEGYALYLCGHSHGGQICLPGGRPLLTNMTRNRRFASGRWHCHGMQGYTSRGAGVSGIAARFFCAGEVTVLTLRRG